MNTTFSSEQMAKTGDLNADLIMRLYRLDRMDKFAEIESINSKIRQSKVVKK